MWLLKMQLEIIIPVLSYFMKESRAEDDNDINNNMNYYLWSDSIVPRTVCRFLYPLLLLSSQKTNEEDNTAIFIF